MIWVVSYKAERDGSPSQYRHRLLQPRPPSQTPFLISPTSAGSRPYHKPLAFFLLIRAQVVLRIHTFYPPVRPQAPRNGSEVPAVQQPPERRLRRGELCPAYAASYPDGLYVLPRP